MTDATPVVSERAVSAVTPMFMSCSSGCCGHGCTEDCVRELLVAAAVVSPTEDRECDNMADDTRPHGYHCPCPICSKSGGADAEDRLRTSLARAVTPLLRLLSLGNDAVVRQVGWSVLAAAVRYGDERAEQSPGGTDHGDPLLRDVRDYLAAHYDPEYAHMSPELGSLLERLTARIGEPSTPAVCPRCDGRGVHRSDGQGWPTCSGVQHQEVLRRMTGDPRA